MLQKIQCKQSISTLEIEEIELNFFLKKSEILLKMYGIIILSIKKKYSE